MTAADLGHLALACAALLAAARLGGHLARRARQPAVLGELLAGLVIGRTGLGHLAPGAAAALFPAAGPVASGLAALGLGAAVLFLLGAGLEIRLATVRAQGRAALAIALAGFALPFALGALAGWTAPAFFDAGPGVGAPAFAIALGAAFAISALPVIARTLQDLGLLAKPFGATVMAAAIVQDLAGWLVFAGVLGLGLPVSGAPGTGAASWTGPAMTLAATALLVLFLFTLGRRGFAALVALIAARAGRGVPALTIAAVVAACAVVACATDRLGIHAAVGALLAGIACGAAPRLDHAQVAAASAWAGRWITPLFFAGIGLRADFVADGDLALDAAVIALACAGKLLGGGLGARLSGSPWREAWAYGAALNARGAMEIVIALVALDHHLIGPRLFVALVAMALATSLIAGPLLRSLADGRTADRGPGSA
jgi:Kef-type K+ transport system membrane component KefB